MRENAYLSDEDEGDAYVLERPDRLGVLSSTRPVVEQGEHVWINRDRLGEVGARLIEGYGPTSEPTWYERYHFFDGTERTVNWLLVLDALNFCFWAEKGQPRWQIEYQGEVLNGYWAEAAALTRAVEEGLPLWDAEYLSRMSGEELAHIFRGVPSNPLDAPHPSYLSPGQGGDESSPYTPLSFTEKDGDSSSEGVMIPLFEQRLEHVHEVGRVLLERFNGQFANAVEEAGGSAVKLALLLADAFASFADVTSYRNREVRFFKRAQICVADLYGAFGGKSSGAQRNAVERFQFFDMDGLTVFADYKVPQVLRHFGVLEYDSGLAGRIDRQELLQPGSEEEVELRAATVWACELLRREVTRAGNEGITAVEIDWRLWHLGQHVPEMKPYHRVRTIYY